MTDVGLFFNWIKIQVRNLNEPSSANNSFALASKEFLIRTDAAANSDNATIPAANGSQVRSLISGGGFEERTKAVFDLWHTLVQLSHHPHP